MLRITWMTPDGSDGRARVEGRVAGPWADELARTVSASLERSNRMVLDLSQVTFVDHHGVAVLNALRERGVELVGGSSFVRSLMDGGADEAE